MSLQIKEIISISPTVIVYTIYNQDGQPKNWKVRKNTKFDFSSIVVGGSYNIDTVNHGSVYPDYDWVKATPRDTATRKLHGMTIKPVTNQAPQSTTTLPDWMIQQQTTRDKLIAAMTAVAETAIPTPELEVLLNLLAQQLADNPELFTW